MQKKNKGKPVTPGTRFLELNKQDLAKNDPVRSLTLPKKRGSGRNCHGRITSRRRGGGHKRRLRIVDFKRDKFDIEGTVRSIEYDPNRSANLALIVYKDGEKRYILAPKGLNVGSTIISKQGAVDEYNIGLSLELQFIPPATQIHAIEMNPGQGAKIARGAGNAARLVSIEEEYAVVKMPSGEIRRIKKECRATIGEVGNSAHKNQSLGKAGRSRWMNRRPRVRGVAMNPVDHPMGGGEGRTSGGGHPVSPWGQLAKGFPTRRKSKASNKMIVVRRNGKRMKN